MMTNSKVINLAISVVVGFVFWQLMTVAADFMPHGSGAARFFSVFGGGGSGYVKLVAYAVFMYGFLDLRDKMRGMTKENEGFSLNLLPVQDQMVLSPDEVSDIKLSIIALEKRGMMYQIPAFIKKACTQFRNEQSIGDTLRVLETQISTSKEQTEGELETSRYIIQAIPMLGFIGTIIELSSAIGLAPQAADPKQLSFVTDRLYVAFDTTLVALALTLVLTLIYHSYLEKMDVFYSRAKSYIIDNLVSRIYKG